MNKMKSEKVEVDWIVGRKFFSSLIETRIPNEKKYNNNRERQRKRTSKSNEKNETNCIHFYASDSKLLIFRVVWLKRMNGIKKNEIEKERER